MDVFSKDELEFVRLGIENNIRVGLRDLTEEREIKYTENILARADKSIEYSLGSTRIIVSVLFKSTIDTLEAITKSKGNEEVDLMKYSNDEINHSNIEFKFIGNFPTMTSFEKTSKRFFLFKKYEIFSELNQLLKEYRIGVIIEINVIEDDGNLCDSFLKAIKVLFKNINIPNINDLSQDINTSVEIPGCKTYAFYKNKKVLADPSLLEESAAEGIIHVFGNKKVSIEGKMEYNALSRVLSQINLEK